MPQNTGCRTSRKNNPSRGDESDGDVHDQHQREIALAQSVDLTQDLQRFLARRERRPHHLHESTAEEIARRKQKVGEKQHRHELADEDRHAHVPAATMALGSGAGAGAGAGCGAGVVADATTAADAPASFCSSSAVFCTCFKAAALAVAVPRRDGIAQLLHRLGQLLEDVGRPAQCLLDAHDDKGRDQHHGHGGAKRTRDPATLDPVDNRRQRIAHEQADE